MKNMILEINNSKTVNRAKTIAEKKDNKFSNDGIRLKYLLNTKTCFRRFLNENNLGLGIKIKKGELNIEQIVRKILMNTQCQILITTKPIIH